MKRSGESETRTSTARRRAPQSLSERDASLLQWAIVDAAIAFRLSNQEYDESCEQYPDGDGPLCDRKLAAAVQNKAMLFALIDRLISDHPINA